MSEEEEFMRSWYTPDNIHWFTEQWAIEQQLSGVSLLDVSAAHSRLVAEIMTSEFYNDQNFIANESSPNLTP